MIERVKKMGSFSSKFAVCSTAVAVLSGCAATMLVGGVMENSIVVTVDESSFSQAARSSLQRAKYLGVVSMDRASIKAADLFETKGGYLVKIDRQTAKAGEMTGSERREALSNLCKAQNIEIALLGRIVKTEAGSTVATAFTGRAKIDQSWVMDMLECKTNQFSAFGGAMKLDVGVYNANVQAEMEEKVGAEIGARILAAIGRDKTGAPMEAKAPAAEVRSAPTAQIAPVQAVAPVQKAVVEVRSMSIAEMQRALLALKYQPGPADGMTGRRTVDALKKFQLDNGLEQTGQLNPETQSKLTEKSGVVPK